MFKLLTKWAMDAHTQKNKNQKEIEALDRIVSEIRELLCFKMEQFKIEVFVNGFDSEPFAYEKGFSHIKLIFYRKGYVVLETRVSDRLLFKKKRISSKFQGFDLWYNKIPLIYLKRAKEIIKIKEGMGAKHED